jgi:hypothetical protein
MLPTMHSKPAEISVLPTLWFYNRWSNKKMANKPSIKALSKTSVKATHPSTGSYYFYFQPAVDLFFTKNETNTLKVNGVPNESIFVKDAFHDAIIKKANLAEQGTKNRDKVFALFIN